MDPKRKYIYEILFNLEPLKNFQLPRPDEEFDYYENSSQDESRCTQGVTRDLHINARMSGKEFRKKRQSAYSSEEEEAAQSHMSEEHYRAMLGDHIQKYKRRSNYSSQSPASTRSGTPVIKSNIGLRDHKVVEDRGMQKMEPHSSFPNGSSSQKGGNHRKSDFGLPHGAVRQNLEPAFLDIADGITYRIPLPYEKLAPSLNLPNMADIQVDEFFLKGTLDLESLAEMMASAANRFSHRSRLGMGEPRSEYDSLQAKLRSPSSEKFNLKISEAALQSNGIPEGAAGGIRRSILSEAGSLQVYYVKVLEKGDTYEIIERSLPKKLKMMKDSFAIEREEMEKIGKFWTNMVRKDIPKHHRFFTTLHRKQVTDAKRLSETCQREVKMKVSRSLKLMRGAAFRTRKLSKDMLVLWKRVDKEMAEVKKREEKEAAEALKREQELREAKRQQQRLNFLISQTEIYSHFMQNKPLDAVEEDPGEVEVTPEEAELRKEASIKAVEAASKAKKRLSEFDIDYEKLQQAAVKDPLQDGSVTDEPSKIDLLHPSTMPASSTVKTPDLFKGCLKEYQLKGLQWLVNCYEQGLNGILADEMGLGKTIQAMAFLAHLAEEKNIWGPFLVVAPASVLSNWADEISRFCPDLKTLPYWGGIQERTVLRKNINPKRLYRRDAGFHILITSYQLLVSDEKYFRRVKWQYMVLDEAQAIKSSNSIRWKTLLSFNCRNRLLLTGTPIQNNMAELWSLLHFIMPTLFDSHEQFNEWFSKGIEGHAEHGGTLNEHQLTRLHAILKPFMLRRVKKDVVSELTGKTEVMVHCKLSSRQHAFYQAIKNKISLAELFDGNRGHLNEKKLLNLMNIVIQLRKVCNHPELFERNEGSSYFHFGEIPNSLLPPPFGELEDVCYAGGRNPIAYKIPKLVYQEVVNGAHDSEACESLSRHSLEKHFSIFSPENIYHSTFQKHNSLDNTPGQFGTFAFSRLIDLSPAELSFLANGSLMERLLFSVLRLDEQCLDGVMEQLMEKYADEVHCGIIGKEKVRAVTRMLLIPSKSQKYLLKRRLATGPVDAPYEALVTSYQDRLLSDVKLVHSVYSFIPRARAPPINPHCSDRSFAYKMAEEWHHPWLKRLLIGFARISESNAPRKPVEPHQLIQEIDAELPISQPALQLTHKIFGSCPPMQPFDPAKMLTDSGKLQTLDILLRRLRAGNHRVLLFAQMTKMLNIIEDYMNYRKYRYLRLDGSSTIMDRRDMVKDFQHRSDIFVFLLSTRAGGLGINLTAADTVIFYESDWNPTLDLQAMDRAHRLGQTKDVTVYRLICKETVEEKILQRASQKSTVQQLVMTGGHVQGDLLAPEDVVSLLIDDAQLEQKLKQVSQQAKDRKKKGGGRAIRIDAEGGASLEDLTNPDVQAPDTELPEAEKAKPSAKKRKATTTSDKPSQSKPKTQKSSSKQVDTNMMLPNEGFMDNELDFLPQNKETSQQRPKRLKRPTKSVNENIEPAFTFVPSVIPLQTPE